MNIQKVIATILVAGGLGLIGMSLYIKNEVEAGKVEVASGQRKVDEGKKLFSFVPKAAPVGEALTGSAQSRIDQGKRDIEHYEKLAKRFMVWGVILAIVGLGVFFLKKKSG